MTDITLIGVIASCGLILSTSIAFAKATDIVTYPRPVTADDKRTQYPAKLLHLGLSKSGESFQIQPSEGVMLQGRALKLLELGKVVDVVWSMTSIDREKKLLPIRVPIYKGLIGWRLPLIREIDQRKFAAISHLGLLKPLYAGQGHDWPDTVILRENGFQVSGVASYEGLFKMLSQRRFDYFPRSIVEIWAEAENHADKGIVVENSIVIKYKTAFYYFVNKGGQRLARLLSKGLYQAIEDGSFDRLFMEHHQEILSKAKLEQRKIFTIPNPILPVNTPLNEPKLWFELKDLGKKSDQ
ncbi:transporter substrate-binding domain-containing protein [Spartinivicinus marinus]|uniref:transporter substrate-binding domain-containing protein n=1 Tax=Spartinivicinus marinus TaxID=2994442 RepID=UPI001C5C9A81|nr:transporter substrate-binding domain-containing protein [Spartinivicinus marinus]MCX4027144.1 transporter substrate-binding domain-containing protein [Spartinivicinus marinus]